MTTLSSVPARGGTPLAPALWWVMQQVLMAQERRKILFILTDGQPDDLTTTTEAIRIAGYIGLEVYGIGVLEKSITQFLPETSRVISRLEELPSSLFDLLHTALGRNA